MKKKLWLGAAILFLLQNLQAQEMNKCDLPDKMRQRYQNESGLAENERIANEQLEQDIIQFAAIGARSNALYIIPVVFHIVHDFGPENISDEQVKDCIRILNEDFSKNNPDFANTIAAFQSIAADCQIEFRLAQKDPNGNCTNGIMRYVDQNTYSGGDNLKTGRQWPRNRYLNIYVANSLTNEGAAAYAYLPGSVNGGNGANIDGIVTRHSYVGSIGTSNTQRSHTISHEVGHYLNLAHPWGSSNNPGLASNCNTDDGVADTPNTIGWTSCNLNGTSCGSLDNVQNHMDYSYCSTMFTNGQKNRIHGTLNSSVSGRNNLWTPANLAFTGTNGVENLCKADFTADITTVCEGQEVAFSDLSFNSPTSWTWQFPGGNPATSSNQNPVVTYNSAGVYNVSLNVSNANGQVSETKNAFIRVVPASGLSEFTEGFENADVLNNKWFIANDFGSSKWEISNNVGYNSSKSAWINNNAQNAGKDELISTTYNLSSVVNPKIKFKVAFAQKTVNNALTNDVLRVFVSNNCGRTWSLRFTRAGAALATVAATNSAFVPTSATQWKEFEVSLISSNLIPGFRYKFVFETAGGNHLYLDDINIESTNVSIEEQEMVTNFEVFPNPNNQNVGHITFNAFSNENLQINIVDLQGRTLQNIFSGDVNQGFHDKTYNVSTLSKGMYLIRVTGKNMQKSMKLIIE